MGKSEGNSETWLVTYSDLVTLLLVFFVLLYTLTPGVDQSTFDNFISYFQNSMSILNQSAITSQESSPMKYTEKWEIVESFLEEHGLSSEVDIEQIPGGIKVTLSDSLTFNSGSSELLPAAKMVLEEVAGVFDDTIQETEVLGHTDNVPIGQGSYYRTNWHLGAARAVTVVQFIQQRVALDPQRFKASSFGEYKPIATNITKQGRRQNRRVEIFVRYTASGVSIGETVPTFESEPETIN